MLTISSTFRCLQYFQRWRIDVKDDMASHAETYIMVVKLHLCGFCCCWFSVIQEKKTYKHSHFFPRNNIAVNNTAVNNVSVNNIAVANASAKLLQTY